jgi:putative sugar O-methyltransferase
LISIGQLAQHFISNSPDFYGDLSIDDIDEKHNKIVNNAYLEFGGANNSWDNFRNWAGQGDGLAPMNFLTEVVQRKGLIKNFAKYLYTKTFKHRSEDFFLQTLRDDYEVLNNIGALSLLKDNPISQTPGSGNYCEIDGYQLNQRWARYIYLLKRITDADMLREDGVWVDVGPFYGGLQGLSRKYYPKSKMVLVDFHHQLCRSYIYLATLYPNSRHILPNEISKYSNFEDLPENSFVYLPASYFDKVKNNKRVDLLSNFFSLGEMRRSHFEGYMQSPLAQGSLKQYFVNRFVSAPFFEKTYDSDVTFLDYISSNRNLSYFDIFPMHHYQIIKRKVLGTDGYRNVSSSYFEVVLDQQLK